jgi:hypothetical protein
MMNNSLLVSFNSSDFPFQAIWLVICESDKVFSMYLIASDKV